MGLNEWLAILGAIGGSSTITWLITFWVNRKTNARKEDASATHADLINLNDYADSWKELYAEAKGEIKELNAKIDSLYEEIKKLRECKAEHIKHEHRLELENEALKVRECKRRGCVERDPPSDY